MQKKYLESKKKIFAKIQNLKKGSLTALFEDSDLMIGSYTEVKSRCGKPTCHCQEKPGHLIVQFLTYDKNQKRIATLIRKADRDAIKKKWMRYKACRKALSQIAKLNQKEIKLLKSIIKTRSFRYR